jgi:hypothetical protein
MDDYLKIADFVVVPLLVLFPILLRLPRTKVPRLFVLGLICALIPTMVFFSYLRHGGAAYKPNGVGKLLADVMTWAQVLIVGFFAVCSRPVPSATWQGAIGYFALGYFPFTAVQILYFLYFLR